MNKTNTTLILAMLLFSCAIKKPLYIVQAAKIEFKNGKPHISTYGKKTCLVDTIFTGFLIYKK